MSIRLTAGNGNVWVIFGRLLLGKTTCDDPNVASFESFVGNIGVLKSKQQVK